MIIPALILAIALNTIVILAVLKIYIAIKKENKLLTKNKRNEHTRIKS